MNFVCVLQMIFWQKYKISMLLLGLNSKDKTSTRDKANVSNPKVSRGRPSLTANRTARRLRANFTWTLNTTYSTEDLLYWGFQLHAKMICSIYYIPYVPVQETLVSKWYIIHYQNCHANIDSDCGVPFLQRQVISWTIAGSLLIRASGTDRREIQTFNKTLFLLIINLLLKN